MTKSYTNLNDEDVEAVCEILDGWPSAEKLTWDSLVKVIGERLDKAWTRQALDKHHRIKQAYQLRKKRQKTAPPPKHDDGIPPVLRKAQECIERLENENRRLKEENLNFHRQFIRWAYNAQNHGLSKAALDKPLCNVDKGASTHD